MFASTALVVVWMAVYLTGYSDCQTSFCKLCVCMCVSGCGHTCIYICVCVCVCDEMNLSLCLCKYSGLLQDGAP